MYLKDFGEINIPFAKIWKFIKITVGVVLFVVIAFGIGFYLLIVVHARYGWA